MTDLRADGVGASKSGVPADTTMQAQAALIRKSLTRSSIDVAAHAALDALVAELDRLRGERDAERNARKVAERNEGTALTDGDAAAARAFNAEAELAAARAELERVTRERDEWRAVFKRNLPTAIKNWQDAEAELVAVRERAERMRDALAFYAEIGFDPDAGCWKFWVAHRGCDDGAAVLVVPSDGVRFKEGADGD